MNVDAALKASTWLAEGGQPGLRALDHPAMTPEPVIAYDDAYAQWGLEAAQYEARQLGDTELHPFFVDANVTDVTALMMKVRASKPDAIASMVYVRPSALVLRKARELGMKVPILQSANGSLR